MRAFFAALAMAFACQLAADTRTVTRLTVGDQTNVVVEYVQGNNRRTESSRGQDGSQQVTILRGGEKAMYQLNVDARQYVEQNRSPDPMETLADMIAKPQAVRQSGKVVDIYFETVDTGERKEFLGREARHLILRERWVAQPGSCQSSSESEREGWYLPEQAKKSHLSYGILKANTGCEDKLAFHGSPQPHSLAVVETNGLLKSEILELSNKSLDPSLFEIPPGFVKVDSLPGQPVISWSQRITWEWAMIERALLSWVH